MGEIMNALYKGAFQPSEQAGLKRKIELQEENLKKSLNAKEQQELDDLIDNIQLLKSIYLKESFITGYTLAVDTLSELHYEIKKDWEDLLEVNYDFELKNEGLKSENID